jgi:uncharacterized protein YndB with AHSA1/START domain
MIRNEIIAHFDRPVDEVFSYVDDDDKVKLWIGGLLETRRTTNGTPGVGSKFHQKLQIGKRVMELNGELVEYERNRRVRVKIDADMCEMNVTYTFTKSGASTELAYTCDSHYRSFFYRLLSPFIKRMAQQKLREDFARLHGLLQPAKAH